MSRFLFKKLKYRIVAAIMLILLLLPGCGSATKDYQLDLGDTSLVKELYDKAIQENKRLERKYFNVAKENTKLKERIAKLRAQKNENSVLSEREAALDEREKELTLEKEEFEQKSEAFERIKNFSSEKAIEIGKTIGRLEKTEERVKELSIDLNDSQNQIKFLTGFLIVLFLVISFLLVFIFLDKYGVLRKISEGSMEFQKTIQVFDVPLSNEKPESKRLEKSEDQDPKALPGE